MRKLPTLCTVKCDPWHKGKVLCAVYSVRYVIMTFSA